MESFAFPAKIISISTEILRKCSKLYFFSLESLEYSFLCFGLVLKEKCINQKAKPHQAPSPPFSALNQYTYLLNQ